MPFYYAILTGARNAPRATGEIDIAFDPAVGESLVHFRVFVNGAALPPPPPVETRNGFARSHNLFDGVPDETHALVQVEVELANAPLATAVLRQKVSGGAKILLGVTPADKLTTVASVAVGDLLSGTHLLIGNVQPGSGINTPVEIVIGNASVGGRRDVRDVGPGQILDFPLQPGDANQHVIVRGLLTTPPAPILVQLTVDDGKVDEATLFPG
jgi:hypothetical protein